MTDDIFKSVMRSHRDVAGVFEYDGEAGYFYPYDLSKDQGQQIRSAINIMSGAFDLSEQEVSVA